MATTTNYGWTTPDDTALVKDGAAAIRTLGTSIDTTTFNNANAAIAKTIVDAKGDLIAATAADTVSRLAVGSNDQVLTADSTAATGLKWATPAAGGGITLLSTTTLSGTSTTISSISGAYQNLIIIIRSATNSTDAAGVQIKPNGSATLFTGTVNRNRGNNYNGLALSDDVLGSGVISTLNTGGNNVLYAEIYAYANTSYFKPCFYYGYGETNGFGDAGWVGGGALATNSAITSITITNDQNYSFNGGTVLIYGAK